MLFLWVVIKLLKELFKHSMTFVFPDASAGRDRSYRCPLHNLGSFGMSIIN